MIDPNCIPNRQLEESMSDAVSTATDPSLEELLASGGRVEAALNPAEKRPVDLSIAVRVHILRHVARADVERMRSDSRGALAALRADCQVAARDMLSIQPGAEPVLRAVLAWLTKDEVAQDVWLERGVIAYRAAYDAYEAAFGELIPSDIRKEVVEDLRSEVKLQRYFQNANATAAEDWDAYQQILAAKQPTGFCLATGLPSLDNLLGGGLSGLSFLGGGTCREERAGDLHRPEGSPRPAEPRRPVLQP